MRMIDAGGQARFTSEPVPFDVIVEDVLSDHFQGDAVASASPAKMTEALRHE
jgi:hypothetical protein